MRRRAIVIAAVAAVAVLAPFGMSGGQLTTATFVVIAAIGAVGLNVLTGYTGQISLGHAFFLAAGAYTAAVLGGNHGVSAVIWIPAGYRPRCRRSRSATRPGRNRLSTISSAGAVPTTCAPIPASASSMPIPR